MSGGPLGVPVSSRTSPSRVQLITLTRDPASWVRLRELTTAARGPFLGSTRLHIRSVAVFKPVLVALLGSLIVGVVWLLVDPAPGSAVGYDIPRLIAANWVFLALLALGIVAVPVIAALVYARYAVSVHDGGLKINEPGRSAELPWEAIDPYRVFVTPVTHLNDYFPSSDPRPVLFRSWAVGICGPNLSGVLPDVFDHIQDANLNDRPSPYVWTYYTVSGSRKQITALVEAIEAAMLAKGLPAEGMAHAAWSHGLHTTAHPAGPDDHFPARDTFDPPLPGPYKHPIVKRHRWWDYVNWKVFVP